MSQMVDVYKPVKITTKKHLSEAEKSENLILTFPWITCATFISDFHVPSEYLTNMFIREKVGDIVRIKTLTLPLNTCMHCTFARQKPGWGITQQG